MHRFVFFALICPAISASFITSASGISFRTGIPEAEYFAIADQFPAVGRIDDDGFAHCTATLVTPTKLLTAAHCLDDDGNGTVDFPLSNGEFVLGADADSPDSVHTFSSLAVSSTWDELAEFDVGVITLSSPITNVIPMNLSDQAAIGQLVTMIGFGENGTGTRFPRPFDGRRRAAQNILDIVGDTLETDFDRPRGTRSTYGDNRPLDYEGTTAARDSGGPLTTKILGVEVILGTLNSGFNPFDEFAPSEYGDISVWAPLQTQANRDFLVSQGLRIGGDFVPDEIYDLQDLDLLTNAIVSGDTDATAGLDMNSDGQVDAADVQFWLGLAGGINNETYRLADANLDGVVDGDDFGLWNANRFFETSSWSEGDWNLDGIADVSDFNLWNLEKSVSAAALAVPEPAGVGVSLIGLFSLLVTKRRDKMPLFGW